MPINETHDSMIEMRTQQRSCRERCDERHGLSVEALDKHDGRITSLERARWQIVGIITGGSLFSGVITALIAAYITKHV